jgi:hypothetical protein
MVVIIAVLLMSVVRLLVVLMVEGVVWVVVEEMVEVVVTVFLHPLDIRIEEYVMCMTLNIQNTVNHNGR